SYNPQVLRDESYMLCVNATTKGNKVAPARSSSALILSSRNANREQVYPQQAPISAPGYSSQAFNPHFPHTVRTTETKTCDDCHVSSKNDNNAWMAQILLHGTNMVNFLGKYAYVALGSGGFEAVEVTETEEPQAVIGSYLQSLAYPDYYAKHLANDRRLKTAYHHSGTVLSIQMRGEYVYTANGPGGFRVYDIANIDNKGYSERIVTAPVSPLGQDTHVKTQFATAVALPTNMPIDTRRVHRPENQEQWPIHPMYSYAYITDRYEGLILVDVMNLVDGDPQNNFLERALAFNPGGILNGAVNLTVAGAYVYVCCDAGLVIVNISDPLQPRIAATVGQRVIKSPRAVAVQFRYAFICDVSGVQAIDITNPERPKLIQDNLIALAEANDIYVARTYAYVAGGPDGLVIIDVENPEKMFIQQKFTADGEIDDARGVKVASTNASVYAYLADGKHGLRVIQLTSPKDTPGYLGFSPIPDPKLIATRHTHGPALSVSKGLDRDRAVDESGNQVSVFGRLGSRPLTLEEQRKLYLRDGEIWRVTPEGGVELPQSASQPSP
ncbi:MAG: LVIVD repeat-containing protein, partial [Candidatus Zixiibacteriota bacterium]